MIDVNENTIDLIKRLRNPAYSMPLFGSVINQVDDQMIRYDPYAITHKLQATLMAYYANPPRTDDGQSRWLVLLGYRQAGKSLAAELAAYPLAAYTPGFDHVCIADKRSRAEYLHKRVQTNHTNWPDDIKSPTISSRESRQLTFAEGMGGKMRTLTAGGENEGIGQSFSSFHGSEIPFWPNADEVMTLAIPAMINRNNSLVVMESTPAPASASSVTYFKDLYIDGANRRGRWLSVFFPFWDGKLNRRKWDVNSPMSNEEISLLDRFGPLGLTKENLAFRRLMMESDPEIRRDPNLFAVFYPFDDLTCWFSKVGGVIPSGVLAKHIVSTDLEDWDDGIGYAEYKQPRQGAIYVIGVDPAGYGARDHASFQVLEVWDGEWTQVAAYGKVTNPLEFSKKLLEAAHKYDAFVYVESNGVGAAVLAYLEEVEYKKLYYREDGKPGVAASESMNAKMLSYLIDALLDCLVIKDKDTVTQLQSYKNDKAVERSAVSEILTGTGAGNRRRSRHHWDKVSALSLACYAARHMPQRAKPEGKKNVLEFKDFTYKDIENYRKQLDQDKSKEKSTSKHMRGPYVSRFRR